MEIYFPESTEESPPKVLDWAGLVEAEGMVLMYYMLQGGPDTSWARKGSSAAYGGKKRSSPLTISPPPFISTVPSVFVVIKGWVDPCCSLLLTHLYWILGNEIQYIHPWEIGFGSGFPVVLLVRMPWLIYLGKHRLHQ